MLNKEIYAEYLYGHLTRYFTRMLGTLAAPGKKIYFFTFLCSIVLAMILTASNYFFGLLCIAPLLIYTSFLRTLHALKSTPIQALQLLVCEAIILIGLILHSAEEPFILLFGLLTLFGFLLIPYFASQSKTTFYTLSFELRMSLLMLSLAINLPILLLFFYTLVLNGQLILKIIDFEKNS